ncbi:ras GTPase-activating protein nGAP isoform X3 [Arapaima gigas]
MESVSAAGLYNGSVSALDSDSVARDPESLGGGLPSLEPVVGGLLADSVCHQQGWLRVFEVAKLLDMAIAMRSIGMFDCGLACSIRALG